jgi:4-amino-4-deoxy-L-arabinose transferase-like glycosyltransferase
MRAAWLCGLVALANGLAWSLIVPPFEVPDENAHYAYGQQVAERGTLPRLAVHEGMLSPAEDATLAAVGFYQIVGEVGNPSPFSALQQRSIEAVGRERLSTRGNGNALSATNNPPLYYALEAFPYKLGAGGTVLDRLTLMRALSAVMGAATIVLVYLFLMELLPGRPWAWAVGALVAAFQPLFGFMSGGVNNDNLLYLFAAGVLWALARAFRRGLSPGGGLLIGGLLGAGLVTKLTLLGFVPAVAAALVLLAWRERARAASRALALRGAAVAVAAAAGPVAVYVALDRFVWKRGFIPGGVGGVSAATPGRAFNFREEVSHIWQLFLPPIGMHRQFADLPLWDTWFKGLVGRFGWLDYGFPQWFYYVALAVALVAVALALGELVRRRRALVLRLGECSVYAAVVAGLCVEIGVQSYRTAVQNGGTFEQPRYLLPLLCLYAAVAALAARGGGRRRGPTIGAGLVMLAIGHDLLSQAVTISRYYS